MELNKDVTQDNNRMHITDESKLPPGEVISYVDDLVPLSENNRKGIIIWQLNSGTDPEKKVAWILALKSFFGQNQFMQVIKDAEASGVRITKKVVIAPNVLNSLYDRRISQENQKVNGDDSIVVRLFEMILSYAVADNISDIHIEVRNNGGKIRMRKNGELKEYQPENRLTFNDANNLCSVIYTVLAANKSVTFNGRNFQQGAVPYNIEGQELKLRYQSLPSTGEGYDVVLRLLAVGRSEDFTPLQQLGYTEQQVAELINISSRRLGALIIAGITGSGKSTTLKNLLMFINLETGFKLKIYTIEDPPEYNIAKVTQIPVNENSAKDSKTETSFSIPIKACMRGDPDIIMIGEVRDGTTADLTKKAVQSGHQVLTTVHSISGLGIIERFEDFGLTRSVLGSPQFLSGLVYQKLLPVVCPHCCIDFNKHINDQENSDNVTPYDLELYQKILTIIDNPENYPIKMRSVNGCKECDGSGIYSRSVCAEVIMLDLEMVQFIEKGETIPLMAYWRSLSDRNPASDNMRGKTFMEHGFQKLLLGMISPHDLEDYCQPIDEMLMSQEDINKYLGRSERYKKERADLEKENNDSENWKNL